MIVGMNSGGCINGEGIVKTFGACGCYCIMIYARKLLTHYSPSKLSDNLNKLEELISKHPEMKEAWVRRSNSRSDLLS